MTNSYGRAMANVLSKVAQAIQQMGKSDIEKLSTDDFHVDIVLKVAESHQDKCSTELDENLQTSISEVAKLLGDLDDRDQGLSLIEERMPTKDLLTHLARQLDLPLRKRETVDQLKEKIIEATIGFRLRSRAIRGTDNLEKTAG